MPLTDLKIRKAKPREKQYKLYDEKGMYLLVHPNGSKYFRLDYRFQSRRKTLALGVYPGVSLKAARIARDAARQQILSGVDPLQAKKAESDRFIDVALRWFDSKRHLIDESTHRKKLRRFHLHVFPIIGRILIADVSSPDVFNVVRPLIRQKKLDSAHRIRAEISEIFAFAIAHGFVTYDPAQPVAKQIPPHRARHHPALTDPRDVALLMKAIYSYEGTFIVQQALKITPLLFQRPGEIRTMRWVDIDFAGREWRYLVTKTGIHHIVPLSDQVIKLLRETQQITGDSVFVFPSSRNDGRPMSENTIRTALRTLGYSNDAMTPHGFRTLASTLLNEQGWSPDAIERQLSHMPRDSVRAAYNRAQYLKERRELMQSWSDFLATLREEEN